MERGRKSMESGRSASLCGKNRDTKDIAGQSGKNSEAYRIQKKNRSTAGKRYGTWKSTISSEWGGASGKKDSVKIISRTTKNGKLVSLDFTKVSVLRKKGIVKIAIKNKKTRGNFYAY